MDRHQIELLIGQVVVSLGPDVFEPESIEIEERRVLMVFFTADHARVRADLVLGPDVMTQQAKLPGCRIVTILDGERGGWHWTFLGMETPL